MIRRSYIVGRLVVLGILWLFFALAFDPLLKWGLEKGGSAALGARLDVGGLKTRLFPPSLTLSAVAATDPGEPMKNVLEFEKARFSLAGRPLLERKLVIDASELSGLKFGTPRKTSGALPKAPASALAAKLHEWAGKSKDVSFSSITDAKAAAKEKLTVKAEDLQSAQLAGELEKRWPAVGDGLKKRAQGFGGDKRVRELQDLVAQAQTGDPLSRAAKAAEALKKLDAFKKEAEDARRELESEAAKARGDLEAVKKAKAGDLDALRARLQLPSLDPERLSAYLLGPETAARLTKALRFVETARQKMPPKGAPREPTSSRGTVVEFPKEHSWPSFWLKHVSLAGLADLGGPLEFKGEAKDFTSDPPLVGRPATLTLAGGEGKRKAKLTALLDHTRETAKDELAFDYAGLPMPALTAGDPASLAVTVSPAPAAVSGSIVLSGPSLTGTIRYRQSGVTLTPATAQGGAAARLAASAFSGIKDLDVSVTLGGSVEEPRFSVQSNLGSALARGLKAAVGKEAQARLADAQKQLDTLVDGRVNGLQGQLDGALSASVGSLGLGKLSELEDKLKKQAGTPFSIPKLFR